MSIPLYHTFFCPSNLGRRHVLKPISREKLLKLSYMIKNIAEEVEYTRQLAVCGCDESFREKFADALSQADGERIEEMLQAPQHYQNYEAYREFCLFLLEGLVKLNVPEYMNLKKEIGQQFADCFTIKELQWCMLQNCIDCAERLNSRENKNRQLTNRIETHIKNNFSNPLLDVQSLVRDFNYSADYLSKLFKKEKGMALSDYIMSLRLQNACRLLIHSNYTIYQIAEQSGYEDVQYFVRLFKKKTGVTPTQYRQKARNKNEAEP